MSTLINLAALDPPQMTLLFLTTVAALAAAFVFMISELERSPQAQRIRMSLVRLFERLSRSRSSPFDRDG